jgi:dihydropteroate synthase
VVGTSRKGFIGRISGEEIEGRVPGTIATNVIALGNGAEVFRVHDVAAVAQALDVAAATFRGQWNGATTTSTTSTTT